MATVQKAVPSHGGETLVTFIKDGNEKYCGPASNFLGLKCDDAGSMKIHFEDIDGAATATVIDITVTDTGGHGTEMKRVCQAIAGAMVGRGTQGKFVKIADTLAGTYIHPDILSVDAVA
jgi:hypothetical protein